MKVWACIHRLAWALLLVGTGSAAGSTVDKAEVTELLAKARNLSDVRSRGAPPFRLRARVRILNVPNGPVEGSYEEIRNSDGKWRASYAFPDLKYAEAEGGEEGKVWKTNNVRYPPYIIYRLRQAIDFESELHVGAEEKVIKVGRRNLDGKGATCFQLKSKSTGNRTVCLDSASGTAIREEPAEQWIKVAYEYSDYFPWKGKVFPKLMRELENGKTFIEVNVLDLADEPQPDPALFKPPAGAKEEPLCLMIKLPMVIQNARPQYPSSARSRGESGQVVLYVVVGTDGRVRIASPIQFPSTALAKSAMEAVTRRWLYQPAMCENTPIPFATFVQFTFNLSR